MFISVLAPKLSMVRFISAGLFLRVVFFGVFLAANVSQAQDLAPRAYLVTPIHSNAITLTYSSFDGSLLFDGTVPITGATARVNDFETGAHVI